MILLPLQGCTISNSNLPTKKRIVFLFFFLKIKKFDCCGVFIDPCWLKVPFIQKVLIHLLFPQTDEPYYFPELEF